MPDTSTPPRQITGDDIITELLRNQQAGLFKLRYTVLSPCIFHVYLHPDDYEYLRPVIRHVREEADRALQEQLERWNQEGAPAQLLRWVGVKPPGKLEYRITQDALRIELHADEEDKLRKGDIEIYSELGSEPREDPGAGERTRLVTMRGADGRTSERQEPLVAPADAYAILRYKDDSGAHEYAITKDTIVVGRGGKSFWVDVKLEAPSDISREHCRIRREPSTGDFFLKDVSQFGTDIDGKPAPTSLELQPGGERKDNNIEAPLPPRACIRLAGMIEIEFAKAGRQ